MPGMERQTINKDPLQGKKIIWIMGMISNGLKTYSLSAVLTYGNMLRHLLYVQFYLISFFCILGGPGSGRGTQCEKLALKYKYKHLSSGDLLRHEVMSGSQRGGNLYKLMANGEAVPNGIVNDVIAEAMVKSAAGSDVIVLSYRSFMKQLYFV